MGCNCKKPKNVQAELKPEPIKTPDELHSKQLNDWYSKLQTNGNNDNPDQETITGVEVSDGQ